MVKQKNFYNVYEIASQLGVCYAKALEWIKSSGIVYIKVGKTYHVNIDVFNKFTCGEANNK